MIRIKDIGIRAKLLSVVSLILVLFSISFIGFRIYFASQAETDNLKVSSQAVRNTVDVYLNNDKKILLPNLEQIAARNDLKSLFKSHDRDGLYDASIGIFTKLTSELGITHLYFINKDGTVFLRVHSKTSFGDVINMDTFKQTVKTDLNSTGVELGENGFAMRTFMPYRDNGETIGYLEIGIDLDHIVSELGGITGNQIEVIGDKKQLNITDWNNLKKQIGLVENWDSYDNYATVAETTLSNYVDECISKTVTASDTYADNYLQSKIGSTTFSCSSIPLKTVSDQTVGSIIYSTDITEIKNETINSFIVTVIFCLSLILIFGISTYLFVAHYIFKPLISLTNNVSRITKSGNLSLDLSSNSKDEVGQLSRDFNNLKDKLHESQDEMELRIKERTSDLERINNALVGRELKMIELKKELAEVTAKKARH